VTPNLAERAGEELAERHVTPPLCERARGTIKV
jgi:hypothetical protein